MNSKLLTVSQYAKIMGISKQAVYKQLNHKLKSKVVMINGVKYIDCSEEDTTKVEQPLNQKSTKFQPQDNQSTIEFYELLQNQIIEKDKVIESLMEQLKVTQEQNTKLTELLSNSQYLLAADKKLLIDDKEKEKEKRQSGGIFHIFKKK